MVFLGIFVGKNYFYESDNFTSRANNNASDAKQASRKNSYIICFGWQYSDFASNGIDWRRISNSMLGKVFLWNLLDFNHNFHYGLGRYLFSWKISANFFFTFDPDMLNFSLFYWLYPNFSND